MGMIRRAVGAAVVAVLVGAGVAAALAAPAAASDAWSEAVSDDARFVVEWVRATRDNRGRPFAIVDKKNALLFLYSGESQLLGVSPVLLGMGLGDHGVPGVGDLPPARIPPAARTTPAGRFSSEPGRNLTGEAVVWFDYDAGLAIHRLRDDAAHASRLQRLASKLPAAQRVSAGCVVVPVGFYESRIEPLLGHGRGVVYVLPEMRPVREVFAGGAWARRDDAGE